MIDGTVKSVNQHSFQQRQQATQDVNWKNSSQKFTNLVWNKITVSYQEKCMVSMLTLKVMNF